MTNKKRHRNVTNFIRTSGMATKIVRWVRMGKICKRWTTNKHRHDELATGKSRCISLSIKIAALTFTSYSCLSSYWQFFSSNLKIIFGIKNVRSIQLQNKNKYRECSGKNEFYQFSNVKRWKKFPFHRRKWTKIFVFPVRWKRGWRNLYEC